MKKLKRVVIKEELVALTGDITEAIILNQFLYWSERVADFDKFITEEKERAKTNGIELNFPLTNGWIYKKISELKDETMLTDSEKTIRRKVQNLVKKGFLQERQNPIYKWDKTLQYRVNLIYIAKKLHEIGYRLEGYKYDLSELVSDEYAGTEDIDHKEENYGNRNFIHSNGQNDATRSQNDFIRSQNDSIRGQNDAAIPIDYNTVDYNTIDYNTIDYNTKNKTTLVNNNNSREKFSMSIGSIREIERGYRGEEEGKNAMVSSAESDDSANDTVCTSAHTTFETPKPDNTLSSDNGIQTNTPGESKQYHCRINEIGKPRIRIFLVTDEENQNEGASVPSDVNNLLKTQNNVHPEEASSKGEDNVGNTVKNAKKEGGFKTSTKRSTKSQQKDELKVKVERIFQHWLSKGIIQHESLTRQALGEAMKVLEVYSEEQIIQAIDNYAYVLKHPDRFWWTYVYSFKNFITKGLEQFIDRRTVMKNYLKEMSPIEKMQKFAETGDWRYLVPLRYEDTIEYAGKKALANIEGKNIDEVDFKSPLFDYSGMYDEDGFLKFPEDDNIPVDPELPDIFKLWGSGSDDNF